MLSADQHINTPCTSGTPRTTPIRTSQRHYIPEYTPSSSSLSLRACVQQQKPNTQTHPTNKHTHTRECREGGRINNNEELVDSTDYGLIYYGHIGGGVSINEYESIQLYHHTVVPIQSYQYSCTYVPTILGMWNVECGTDGSIRNLN